MECDIAKRFVVSGLFVCLTANGAPLVFQSSEHQAALVELYTSEGCSSCPPAESWLSGLKEKPGLWSDFVPVSFHVDYWNNLGWTDKWSNRQYSDRQRDYAEVWGSQNIYTPEFVLNGKEWHNWFGLRGAPGGSGTKAGILKVTSDDTHDWQARFDPAADVTASYEVNAALLVSGLGSDVKAGENSGRHLRHDFVAITLTHAPLVGGTNGFQAKFTLSASQQNLEGNLALAVWVSRSGSLAPIQALGGWLAQSAKPH